MIIHEDFAARMKAIIDTALDGIITIDESGRIETVNKAVLKLFKYSEEELLGEKINILMPEPHSHDHDYYIQRYLRTGVAHIIGVGREIQGKKSDGTIFPFHLGVSKVEINNKILFTGIIHDLTEVKKVEERIQRLNEELEQKVSQRTYELESVVNRLLGTNAKLEEEIYERKLVEEKLKSREEQLRLSLEKEKELSELKSRFVSMASHEFRTPLSTILSSASLISRYESGDQHQKRLKHTERIKSAVANLTGILNDFLSISKLEEGKIDIEFSTVNIEDLCNEVIQEVEGLMKDGQCIELEFNSEERMLRTDGRIFKNILFNLISNAIKYSYDNGRIECLVSFGKNTFTLEIRDYGIGIPDEDQKHMFQRFFRAGNVTNIQGTGLGLNIVQRYVKLLEGNISFKSIFGKGSSFYVNLPYRSTET